MYGGYKIGPLRIDPTYKQVVTKMYIAIYLKIEGQNLQPPNKYRIKRLLFKTIKSLLPFGKPK
jgi:hypothetical protein